MPRFGAGGAWAALHGALARLWMARRGDVGALAGKGTLKRGGHRRSSAAQRNHGSYRSARHGAGNGRPPGGASHRLPVPSAQKGSAGPSRSGLSETPTCDFRSWLLLAPARRLRELHDTEDPAGILAEEISRQCRARPPRLRTIGTATLANAHHMGVRGGRPCASRLDSLRRF